MKPAGESPAFQPLYRQIKTLITQSLVAGEWRPGASIPSEIELASRYSVSQGTVRKAVSELAEEKLLVRQQGKGTFVATYADERSQFPFLRIAPDAGELKELSARLLDLVRVRDAAPEPGAVTVGSGRGRRRRRLAGRARRERGRRGQAREHDDQRAYGARHRHQRPSSSAMCSRARAAKRESGSLARKAL